MSLCRSRFTTNGTGRKRVKGETSLKTLSYRELGKTCQAVWVARQGSEWPKLDETMKNSCACFQLLPSPIIMTKWKNGIMEVV